MAEVENLILERLRRLDERMEDMRLDSKDFQPPMTAVEEHLPGIRTGIIGLDARMDRFDEQLGRVERRLKLTDAS